MKTSNQKKEIIPHRDTINRVSKDAFTLVELIVVVTILAILSTIGFISFSSYLSSARDSVRISDLSNIQMGLSLFLAKSGAYPLPENVVGTGIINGVELSYVGKIEENIALLIKFSKTPIDPLLKTKYIYGVSADQESYQIATVLENTTAYNNNPFIQTTYAANTYQAKVIGDYKGYMKFYSGSNLWLANVPSLIFNNTGTVNLLSTGTYFIVDKQKNLPYQFVSSNTLNSQNGDEIIKAITGIGEATLTGVQVSTCIEDQFTGALLASFKYNISTIQNILTGENISTCLTSPATNIDFTTESNYIQQDATNGTDFTAGAVQLNLNNTTIDLMEYSTNTGTQAAYVTNSAGINLLTNSSFETYTTTPGPPDLWIFFMDSITPPYPLGIGGSAEKETLATNVKVGNNSCKITKSTEGSGISQTITGTAQRGKSVTLGGWIKSATSAGITRLTLWTDGTNWSYAQALYQNSGNWEYVTTSQIVPADATVINAQSYVSPLATAVGYFDNLSLVTGSAVWDGANGLTYLQSYSEPSIKTQGSYSLKGKASITDSLNKTLTKTIASPINLTGINTLKFDIRSNRTGSNIKLGLQDSGGITTEITPNITSANTFQTVTWDISAVTDINKDAINKIIITVVNADVANTFYIDDLRPGYPVSQGYYTTTSTSSQINTSTWSHITNIVTTQTTPTANTTIKYLVSFDNRATWKYWNVSAWATSTLANININGMTKTTLESINQTQWESSGGFIPGTTTALNFAADLKTTDTTMTPSLDNILVNYQY